MSFILSLMGLLLAPPAENAAIAATTAPALTPDQPYHMPGAVRRVLIAADGEPYNVLIAVPDAPPPPGGYPVLYVLDGEDNFPIVAATARRLIRAGARSGVEAGLIVAIEAGGISRRARDYTPPTTAPAIKAGQPGHGLPTGGADRFLDFIATVVDPAIMRDFHANPQRRSILGHSFGGVLVAHALLHRPGMFTNYIAASPSIWIADGEMIETAKGYRAPSNPPRLIVTLGDAENGPNTGAAGDNPAKQFADTLGSRGVDSRFRLLCGETHGTSMAPTISEAILAAFGAARNNPGGDPFSERRNPRRTSQSPASAE